MQKTLSLSATALAFAAGLGGCAAVHSTPVALSANQPQTGLQYSLPKGLLRVELIESADDGLYLAISEPFFVGDVGASYMLDGASGAFANQEYYFEINPRTRLLTFVDSTSEGQAGNIARALAGAAGGANALHEETSAAAAEDRVIFSRVIDPFQQGGCSFASACNFGAAAGLNGGPSLSAELRRAALESPNCTENHDLCKRIQDNSDFFSISLHPLFDASGAAPRASAADCERAICYRSPLPYAISLRAGNASDRSEIIHMPNQAPAMALRVPAGLFATTEARIDLVHGMPREYEVDRNNEIVAFATLPLEVVRAGFRAASEVFQLRIKYNNDRSEFRRNQEQNERPLDGGAAENTAATNNPQDEAGETGALFRVELAPPSASGNASGSNLGQ